MAKRFIKPASRPTIRRLPTYRQLLLRFKATEREFVSCTHISNELKLDSTQVRKDLSVTGIVGKPRVGYEIDDLIDAIESFLGWNNSKEAFLIGAGSLGKALLGYQGFVSRGLNIVAAFDTDPTKIGKTIHGKEIFDLDKFPDLADRMHINIGVLAAPAEHAQQIAHIMVLSGIKAIWNFAPAHLEVPDEIVVENVDLSGSLAVLSNKLTDVLHKEK